MLVALAGRTRSTRSGTTVRITASSCATTTSCRTRSPSPCSRRTCTGRTGVPTHSCRCEPSMIPKLSKGIAIERKGNLSTHFGTNSNSSPVWMGHTTKAQVQSFSWSDCFGLSLCHHFCRAKPFSPTTGRLTGRRHCTACQQSSPNCMACLQPPPPTLHDQVADAIAQPANTAAPDCVTCLQTPLPFHCPVYDTGLMT